jgi:phospholipid transport system transporter-binding protein
MTAHTDITLRQHVFYLSGVLSFANVMSVYSKSLAYFAHEDELNFDFSELKGGDSSGLALAIEWMKYAKKVNKKIKFLNMSNDLLAIAKAANIDRLFLQG